MPPQNQPSPFEISTSGKSKKGGNKGIIVAVLIVLFLILSIVAGVLLVRQRQDIRERAVEPLPNTVTFPKSGTMRIYYTDFTRLSNFNQMLMRFQKGSQAAQSATLPGGPLTPPAKMEILDTNIEIIAGDTYSVTQFYGGGSNTTQPSLGWLLPSGGKCGPAGQADVSQMIAWATVEANGEPLVSQQCWADWASNPNDPSVQDYNDFFIILSYVPAIPTPTPTPTPTATPIVTPTPTPTPAAGACNSTCTSNSNCESGLVCTSGSCKNPLCTSATNCSCVAGTPTPTSTSISTSSPVAQTSPRPIPETGTDWPTVLGVGIGAAAIILSILIAL